MAEPPSKRALVHSKAAADPVNGVKFDEVHLDDPVQLQTLRFRQRAFVNSLEANVLLRERLHASASEAVWDEERLVARVPRPKGKHWKSMGHAVKVAGEGTVVCLYPEETLWMVDSGNLLLRDANGARIDRQWLWERLFADAGTSGLAPQHYAAYCHFRSLGFAVLRWRYKAPSPSLAANDPTSWTRIFSSNEPHAENVLGPAPLDWVLFEVWKPAQLGSFKKSDPPPSDWRVLPWPIDSSCWPAAAWSSVAGSQAMVALSDVTGATVSFFQVSWTALPRNAATPAEWFSNVQPPTGLQRQWFPPAQQWIEWAE